MRKAFETPRYSVSIGDDGSWIVRHRKRRTVLAEGTGARQDWETANRLADEFYRSTKGQKNEN